MADAWTEAMLDGDFETAWRISDAVLRERAGRSCAHLPPHLRWLWDGTPLAGAHVLVRCWHGLGDTLQFIRFIPRVAGEALSVAVEAQAELLPLLRLVAGIDGLLPLGASPPRADVEIESMELAHALRLRLDDLPGPVPYLRPPRPPRRRRGGRLRVGLAWQAGDWRRERSLPPALLAPLAGLDVETVGLVPGAREPWLDAAIATATTLADTAALLPQLDLVISVDTMVAHLAGALARPTWLLLDAAADWRWLRDRATSPWYPTMRLLRQPRAGAWEPVVEKLTAALARVAAERRDATPRSEQGRSLFTARTGDGGA